ncbi:hypothetical protein [Nocardia asteroides]|uniref:hypothetical protein n=1 Tax=Nocardia asteroides TaxID=1824 RepID=UPI001E49890B|nr:hypothetical protein [Nocardia asteroides]UGT55053.1 hypothetical protein LTT85_31450 [Nocardia asteroides]
MNGSNESNSPRPAARQPERNESAGALAWTENPPTFDCSLPTLIRQLQAMTSAGWLTGVTEPSGELR